MFSLICIYIYLISIYFQEVIQVAFNNYIYNKIVKKKKEEEVEERKEGRKEDQGKEKINMAVTIHQLCNDKV